MKGKVTPQGSTELEFCSISCHNLPLLKLRGIAAAVEETAIEEEETVLVQEDLCMRIGFNIITSETSHLQDEASYRENKDGPAADDDIEVVSSASRLG